jgi:hypothetical protein
MTPSAAASELTDLLDRLAAVSETAARACSSVDAEMVDRALTARDAMLARARQVLRDAGRLTRDARWSERLDRVARADQALVRALAMARDATQAELNALDRQRAGLNSYGAPERVSHLDIRR